jgi:acyl carrier protein
VNAIDADDAAAGVPARLLEILVRVLAAEGLPTEGITAETQLFDDAGVDSLLLISFLLEVEAELDTVIEFESLDYADLSTVARLAAALGGVASGAEA